MTQHDYKAVLDDVAYLTNLPKPDYEAIFANHGDAIRRALKVAHKLMQEPSIEMLQAASFEMMYRFMADDNSNPVDQGFKAMIDQMLKEVEHG